MKSRRLLMWASLSCLGVILGVQSLQAQAAPAAPGAGAGAGGGAAGAAGGQNSGTSSSTAKTPSGVIKLNASSSGAGTATSWPSSSNLNVQWYGDPLSYGVASQWTKGPPAGSGLLTGAKVTFGKGIYITTNPSTQTNAPSAATQANGFTTTGVMRNPPYATVLSSDLPFIVHNTSALQSNLRAVIDRSTRLKDKPGIQVVVGADNIVALRGQVASERERLIVEGMVSMTPGVRGVQNELKVMTK